MRIDPASLLVFLGVTEAGGFNRASSVIHKSQPALTRTVHQLETAVGVPLFSRHANGIELTPEGELLLGHARAIRHELKRAEESLERMKVKDKVSIRIGTVAVHPLDMFARALADVTRENPNASIAVLIGSEADMIKQLNNGDLSFVVLPMPRSMSMQGMTCVPIFLDEAAIYCQADHPLAHVESPTVFDLQSATWMLGPPGTLLRHRFEMIFLAAGIDPPKIALEIEDVRLRRALMTECNHLSVFAKHHVANLVKSGQLISVPFELPQDRRPIVALQLGSSTEGKLMQQFVERLRDHYQSADLTILPNRQAR
ncbi:LysR family transcriptional regulator [Paraburkholderia sp. LEh10]|uniref:LysR substrate-binding domain-containing protein n=1 Tax=Paraburkholderia sp. LEh10 TaxID=2821353 RepID=UPI001AE4C9AF|nr:LysR substrate-binding domain-containing protein [Paraburkholderia sp. LEh10]MBP0590395.1 LysR family transcriptional regulator [Paraburkholderia sp. LEh10]